MMRVLPVHPEAILVELPDLAAVLALQAALQADPVPGIAEMVPAARTLLIRLAGRVAEGGLAAEIGARLGRAAAPALGPEVEVTVTYEGADLAEVAAHMGRPVAAVIATHQAAAWQVAFCGFAPGFAYLTCDDPDFDLPRRASPRARIPAGAVALAGRFSGIYPTASPGGWQLIGQTALPMWDLARDPPALLQPGARVRFVSRAAVYPAAAVGATVEEEAAPRAERGLRVLATLLPITVQDMGRGGQAAQGVACSGALDRPALRAANRLVGNPPGAAALELPPGPMRLTVDQPVELALTGAIGAAVIEGDRPVPVPHGQPFALDAGEVLALQAPQRGMRGYLARRGGFAVAPVLGSAARDDLAGLGPLPLRAGDVIGLGDLAAGLVQPALPPARPLPAAGEVVRLPVTLGPRADWFAPDQVARFLAQDWRVTDEVSRTGLRLAGVALARAARELPSEGTVPGAVQVPHSGQPVLFLADHPLTGGYPVIACVHPEALPLAGQVPPGALIRFVAAHPFAEIAP